MLQRAATNAYSWWWASHIRTKQSKWLEQSLQDMEEKVAATLQIINENGDSFAQRAEMYYRKRPELVNFVEESFRAYRALAERYDHLSRELQSANRTIASVFPEQVQYRMDEDDDEVSVRGTNASSPDRYNQAQKPAIPKDPNIPKDFRSPSMLLTRKGPPKGVASSAKSFPTTPTSGLSKAEALAEVDKLQKEILGLQTEKEFVRSLYERSYEKYWEIEDQITGMQKRVCNFQDEFGICTVIEDNDARTLMAATALNSCKKTLAKLQEVQEQSSEDAKAAYQRVKEAHEKFETLRDQFITKHSSQLDQGTGTEPSCIEEEMASLEEETHKHDAGPLQEKIKEKLQQDSDTSLTMTEMAEMIDELVSKVVTLETAVSSQSGLVQRLTSETEELQTNVQSLEEDKEVLIEDSEKSNEKLKELEMELRRVKLLSRSVKLQDNSLQTHFTEASVDLEHLSGRLNNVKLDEEGENIELHEERSVADVKPREQSENSGDNLEIMKDVETTKEEKEGYAASTSDITINEENKSNLEENIDFGTDRISKLIQLDKNDLPESMNNLEIESPVLRTSEEEDQRNWRQMFVSGLDEREKILLDEYTSVLNDYKDVKVKLNDAEKKNRDSIFELALQVRELKKAVSIKDKEINVLQHKLTTSETNNPEESPYTTLSTEHKYTPRAALLQNAPEGSITQETEIQPSNTDASVRTPLADQHAGNTRVIVLSSANTILLKARGPNRVERRHSLSTVEKKFRSDIDDLLEENLEFWLRFSTSVHQIQKFQNSIQDLKSDLRKINENKNNNNSEESSNLMQSEIKPIFRHLREIRTELTLWLEHNAVLQDELQSRHPTLCGLQDEIARAANPESEAAEKAELSEYQAAKFQGEVLNMKQESNRVSSELQAGLSFVKGLKIEVEKILEELGEVIGVNNNSNHVNAPEVKHPIFRTRIPLRSFLFGVKLRKHRQSGSSRGNNNNNAPPVQKGSGDVAPASNSDGPV